MNKKEEKRELRKKAKEIISLLSPAYCGQADRSICDLVTGMPEYLNAETIFCYVGAESEINTIPILQDAMKKGKRVGVPKCMDKRQMEVRELQTLKSLTPGTYGILEPPDASALILPNEIDFALLPCLACSPDGIRLGHGGGYYDRYLESTSFMTAVLCKEALIMNEIPVEVHDKRADIVISERGITRMISERV